MMYPVAERFVSVQGEGQFAGTPMAFIRFVGCSVGKRVCHACDTDFEQILNFRGGGSYTVQQLLEWSRPLKHVCLTGGEPLDQDLQELIHVLLEADCTVHIETSGTKLLWDYMEGPNVWITCSPKPKWIEGVVMAASELKIIVPGLGHEAGWPSLDDALRWCAAGKLTYVQPRNTKLDIDRQNLLYCQDIIREHPQLRLSVQLHKILHVQ